MFALAKLRHDKFELTLKKLELIARPHALGVHKKHNCCFQTYVIILETEVHQCKMVHVFPQ